MNTINNSTEYGEFLRKTTSSDPLLDALAKPPPPPSELDELIQRNPLDLSSDNIDDLIAMQRQHRARKETGGRTRKAKDDGPSKKIDLALLGLVKKQPSVSNTVGKPAAGGTFVRRI